MSNVRAGSLTALVALTLAAVLLGIGPSMAGEASEEIGLRIGEAAPAFTLKDQHDNEVSLEALLKKGPVMLVFYRSAAWCLYCKLRLIQLQRNLRDIESSGGQVAGISRDSATVLKSFAERKQITFPLLSDATSRIIDAYDMRTADASPDLDGISRHAIFVIDQKGIIRAKPSVTSSEDRPVVEALVDALTRARQ